MANQRLFKAIDSEKTKAERNKKNWPIKLNKNLSTDTRLKIRKNTFSRNEQIILTTWKRSGTIKSSEVTSLREQMKNGLSASTENLSCRTNIAIQLSSPAKWTKTPKKEKKCRLRERFEELEGFVGEVWISISDCRC